MFEADEMADSPLVICNDSLLENDLNSLTKDELDEFQRLNEESIMGLEAEIKLLERQIKQFGFAALTNNDLAVIVRPDGTDNEEYVMERLEQDINKFTLRLKETMHLTHVTLENVERTIIELDDCHCKKQFSLEMLILNRKIHFACIMEESLVKNEISEQGGKLIWFEIKMEEDINDAIGANLAEYADKLSLSELFSLLRSYLLWQADQEQALKHCIETYPDNVSVVTSKHNHKCLKVTGSQSGCPEFIIDWGRQVLNSQVKSQFKVQVIAPEDLIDMDSTNILGSVTDMFVKMVDNLGLVRALQSFIRMVATDGKVVDISLNDTGA